MTDQPYTKREQDEWRRDVKESLTRIEGQTTKTNGRVGRLERWQAYVIGFCACVTIVLIPVVLLLLQIYLHIHG